MLPPNIQGIRRLSSNVVIGASLLGMSYISDAGGILKNYASIIRIFVPNLDDIFGIFSKPFSSSLSGGENTNFILFFLGSWLIGELFTRASEFKSYKEIKSMKIDLGTLEEKNKEWSWLGKKLHKPLFALPDRSGIREQIEGAVKLAGYKVGKRDGWYKEDNNDLLKCFEIAEFVVGKSGWMREALQRWEFASHVCRALSLTFGFGVITNVASLPAWVAQGNLTRAVAAPFLGWVMAYLCSKASRLSAYFDLRRIDQLFTWFILTATAPKRRGTARSPTGGSRGKKAGIDSKEPAHARKAAEIPAT